MACEDAAFKSVQVFAGSAKFFFSALGFWFHQLLQLLVAPAWKAARRFEPTDL